MWDNKRASGAASEDIYSDCNEEEEWKGHNVGRIMLSSAHPTEFTEFFHLGEYDEVKHS